jgi:hypothetical protein
MCQYPKMSVYTIFLVLLPPGSPSLRGLAITQVEFLDTPLDRATYNCPWENTGSGRYTPTFGNVCPCALLIVIVKLRRTGNCFLLNLKGRDRSSEGDKGILGMNTLHLAFVPLTIYASIICLSNALDDTTNIHPGQRSISCIGPRGWYGPS